jgi:hypothetical protein
MLLMKHCTVIMPRRLWHRAAQAEPVALLYLRGLGCAVLLCISWASDVLLGGRWLAPFRRHGKLHGLLMVLLHFSNRIWENNFYTPYLPPQTLLGCLLICILAWPNHICKLEHLFVVWAIVTSSTVDSKTKISPRRVLLLCESSEKYCVIDSTTDLSTKKECQPACRWMIGKPRTSVFRWLAHPMLPCSQPRMKTGKLFLRNWHSLLLHSILEPMFQLGSHR